MVITVDNRTGFASNHFEAWADLQSIELDLISPGRPVENAHIESFDGRLRDESPNTHWLESLDEAMEEIEDGQRAHKDESPHSSLDNQTPSTFSAWLAGHGPPATRRTWILTLALDQE